VLTIKKIDTLMTKHTGFLVERCLIPTAAKVFPMKRKNRRCFAASATCKCLLVFLFLRYSHHRWSSYVGVSSHFSLMGCLKESQVVFGLQSKSLDWVIKAELSRDYNDLPVDQENMLPRYYNPVL
jgi:hypothetical protein